MTVAPALLLALAAAAAPAPREAKVFGDWFVACDNGRDCGASSLIPQGADDGGWAILEISRKAAAEADPVVRIVNAPPTAVIIVEHGRSGWLHVNADGVAAIEPVGVASLSDALRSTDEVTLLDAHRAVVARISAKGAAAALLFMDDRQGRVGALTAVGKPGMRSFYGQASPSPLPVIEAAPPSGKPPLRLSAGRIKELQGDRSCGQPSPPPAYARLDAGHSVALVTDVCASGAYNRDTAVEIISDARPTDSEPAELEAVAHAQEGDGVFDDNAEWDAKAHVLRTAFFGRSLGDCRTEREYVWDGRRFRLAAQRDMGECRGGVTPISTWRTEVRRR